MGMPLQGMTVVDVTVWQQGPLASAILADMGAEVLKVEELPKGDPMRGLRQVATRPWLPASSHNWNFELFNRGKKSIAIDLRKEAAKEVIHRLVKMSDVFVSNLRARALQRWALDYPSLRQTNPRVIYAIGSGFGPVGVDAELPAFDHTALARSGFLSLLGEPDAPPSAPPTGIADKTAALFLVCGILLALAARERTGIGQEVHTSLLGASIYLCGTDLQYHLGTGAEAVRIGRKETPNPLRNCYAAKGDRWLAFNMSQSDRYWPTFCEALGILDLRDDPRFASMEARACNARELISILDGVFARRTMNEWAQTLAQYELAWAPVATFSEVAKDPQVRANNYVVDFGHPVLGAIAEVGFPIFLSETPPAISRPAPEFGQHTEEVMLDAGYTWEEIQLLKEKEVIL